MKIRIHTHPNGSKSQIEFIMINKKWINSALNCEAYNTFEAVYSDHRIIRASIKISFRANKKLNKTSEQYNWSMLYNNNKTYKIRSVLTLIENLIPFQKTLKAIQCFFEDHTLGGKGDYPIKT